MGKIFFDVGMSLDGFIAGINRGPKNPLADGGTAIHNWMYKQKFFREALGWGKDGETGLNNDILKGIFQRSGASILGKRMFEEGEPNWPENAPFHTPVYVLTHEKREPWERKGGTTFFFLNDGIESALQQAKKSAGNKDIRISGGADVIQQFMHAGLIDEFTIHLAPVFLGNGIRLFDQTYNIRFMLEIFETLHSPDVTHLSYTVKKRQDQV